MIRFQIVERPGANLFKTLKEAIGTGDFRTLIPMKRGRKVAHSTYPGWMNWSHRHGVILCEVLSPNVPGREWQLFSAFVGRLADRKAGSIHSITIQFPDAEGADQNRPRKKPRR